MTDVQTRPGAVFTHTEVADAHAASGKPYHQYLTVPALSAGIYALPAGGENPQSPHDEDEIYVILTGKARITIDGVDYPAARGDTIFVAKHVEHRFHSIEEDLRLLVVFAPAHAPQG